MAYVKPERVAGEDYLFVRRGARGATYQYIRGVPAAVAHLVGRTIWQHSLGSDLPSARRQATAYAAQHDQLAKPDVLKLATIPHGVIDLSKTVVMEPVTRHMRLDEHGQWQETFPLSPLPSSPLATAEDLEDLFVSDLKPELPGNLADLDPAEALAAVARYQRALRDWQDQEDMRAEMAPLTAALVASNGTAPPGTTFGTVTVDAAMEAWFKARSHRRESRDKIERIMTRFRESVGGRSPIASINQDHIDHFVATVAKLPTRDGLPMHYRSKPMAFLIQWHDQNKAKPNVRPISATTVYHHLRAVAAFMKWATWRYRLTVNPCAGAVNGIPKETRPPEARHVASIDRKLAPAFIADLTVLVREGNVAAHAMLFTILTVSRKGSVLNMRWRELDMASTPPVWTVPAENMKTNTEHRVPLSQQAVACLGMPGAPDDLVFGHLRRDAMGDLRRRTMKRGSTMTEHGWRTTFTSFAGNEARVSRDLAQMTLAHKVGNAVERAYMRDTWEQQRGELLQKWADYLIPG